MLICTNLRGSLTNWANKLPKDSMCTDAIARQWILKKRASIRLRVPIANLRSYDYNSLLKEYYKSTHKEIDLSVNRWWWSWIEKLIAETLTVQNLNSKKWIKIVRYISTQRTLFDMEETIEGQRHCSTPWRLYRVRAVSTCLSYKRNRTHRGLRNCFDDKIEY